MKMTWLKTAVALLVTATLAACGGGGGSAGNTTEQYSITLRADRTSLPINIAGDGPGMGVYSPYTTTLYVNAKEGNDAILDGKEIFGCNLEGGVNSGALYYLDGDSQHETEVNGVKVPNAYRSIVLGANAGGSSFHFHSDNEAGVARIKCSVTDPRDKRVYTASVDITVGGATQKPASVIANWAAPSYLGTQFNTHNIRNNIALQVQVHDDANQPVPNPAAANLQVSLLSTNASSGARLLSGSQSGSVVQVSTTGGVGLVSVSSGPNRGVLLFELTADRYDNNIANGIQDPVTQLLALPVVNAIATEALAVGEADKMEVVNGMSFASAMTATGGVPPYTWKAVGLPNGLTMSSDGLISGTPNAAAGTYAFVVTVTDDSGASAVANLSMTVTGETDLQRAFSLNCTGSSTTCALPGATAGSSYSYIFSASSSSSTPITWSFSGLPSWLSGNSSTGTISGTPQAGSTDPKCPAASFTVTATQGGQSLSRTATIAVTGSACAATPTTP